MDRKEAIERIQEVMTIIRTQHMCKDMDGECTEEDRKAYIQRFEALRMAIEALQEPQVGGWIPVTYHIPTREDGDEVLYAYILDCPMPEEGQEILVSFNGIVDMDVCCYDEGWYLDNRGDWTDVDAWMPLPEPYKESEEE